MKAVETTYIIDYLAEADGGPAGQFLSAHESVPFYVPTLVLNEVYRGAIFSDGGPTVDALASQLAWLSPLPFTESSAREAVDIERELKEKGSPINQLDVLIAGVVRDVGAELTSSRDFIRRMSQLRPKIQRRRRTTST